MAHTLSRGMDEQRDAAHDLDGAGTLGGGPAQQEAEQEMIVGSGDLIYTLRHGYYSYSNRGFRLVDETTSASDGPAVKGYSFDEQAWQNILAGASACDVGD